MNVSKAKTATIMNKFTIQQLQQMRESEDRVEFKAGEGGNVSYDGRGRTNPKDRRRCILGYVIALCNEGGGRLVIGMHDKLSASCHWYASGTRCHRTARVGHLSRHNHSQRRYRNPKETVISGALD